MFTKGGLVSLCHQHSQSQLVTATMQGRRGQSRYGQPVPSDGHKPRGRHFCAWSFFPPLRGKRKGRPLQVPLLFLFLRRALLLSHGCRSKSPDQTRLDRAEATGRKRASSCSARAEKSKGGGKRKGESRRQGRERERAAHLTCDTVA